MSPSPVLAGRYALREVLGRGGVADVHRADDLVLDRAVAVKVLRDTADNETDRARFVAEARTVANLTHPGLVTVLDAGIGDSAAEQPFLVMELVEGRTLAARLEAGPCELTEVASVARQLAAAIAYAHERDIAHRDVKPANVLLSDSGTVKLADFGIARLIGDTVRHTRTGTAVGTAAYIAPEQVAGEDLTTALDVYSLGLVLLEMITGDRAFPGTPTEAALARLARPPEIPASVPPAWRELVSDMTARDPARRPTAAEVGRRIPSSGAVGAPSDSPTDAGRAGSTAVLNTVSAAVGPEVEEQSGPRARLRRVSREHLVLGAVAVVFVLALVVASLTADGGSGRGADDVPADVPTQLREPLQRLHDAVEGSGP